MGQTQPSGAPACTLFHGHSHLLEARAASCKTHIPFLRASVRFPSHTKAAAREATPLWVVAGEQFQGLL